MPSAISTPPLFAGAGSSKPYSAILDEFIRRNAELKKANEEVAALQAQHAYLLEDTKQVRAEYARVQEKIDRDNAALDVFSALNTLYRDSEQMRNRLKLRQRPQVKPRPSREAEYQRMWEEYRMRLPTVDEQARWVSHTVLVLRQPYESLEPAHQDVWLLVARLFLGMLATKKYPMDDPAYIIPDSMDTSA
ncbi:hypothetical protein BD626DRAFT_624294 [Schizophyllum amplum]|uniref:Uncharacterized protein n=1 Tax=Schizophyllum amplum TaxID=97359 RepID=A0A550CVK6_9AGAR|nr:hypothetical protein BD626DRAFT_624294 [Auriculariopsis ampla]